MKLLRLVLAIWFFELVSCQQYLVRLKNAETLQQFKRSLKKYKNGATDNFLKSFSFGNFKAVVMDITEDMAESLKENPLISKISPNYQIEAYGLIGSTISKQNGAPRHLSRSSRRSSLPGTIGSQGRNGSKLYYYYDDKFQGESTNVYIIDTGVDIDNPELGGRASYGINLTPEDDGDFNGHGTHIAGIIGSATYGIAKKVNIIDVKALDDRGRGKLSTILDAMEFTVNHCQATKRTKCVANLSLGSVRSSIVDEAVRAAFEVGVIMVVAAGNSNEDACKGSPASSPDAITVGAFDDATDSMATFSNYGNCTDILAPGVRVESLSYSNENESKYLTGTSMAAPSVAGIVAILLDKGVSWKNVKEKLIEISTKDFIDESSLKQKPGTPNRIAFNGVSRPDDSIIEPRPRIIDVDEVQKDLDEYLSEKNKKQDTTDLSFVRFDKLEMLKKRFI